MEKEGKKEKSNNNKNNKLFDCEEKERERNIIWRNAKMRILKKKTVNRERKIKRISKE